MITKQEVDALKVESETAEREYITAMRDLKVARSFANGALKELARVRTKYMRALGRMEEGAEDENETA